MNRKSIAKTFLFTALMLCFLFSCAVGQGYATQVTETGSCGENLTYTLYDDGELVIRGTGKMTDRDIPWYYSGESIIKVTIEPGVTSIGERAFGECSNLTRVTIPDSVTSIGDSAFVGCHSLTGITIPDGVTSIGNQAFSGCSSLTNITIPNNVTGIGNSAFSGCSSLTNITLPDGVTSIGNKAFSGCISLTSIMIPGSVTSIGLGVFPVYGNLQQIQVSVVNEIYASQDGVLFNKIGSTLIAYPGGRSGSYIIPNGVTSISAWAFDSCDGLTSIMLPNSLTSIGVGAFSYCRNLTDITIPDSVTCISYGAFESCDSLTSITIPDSVTIIDESAFAWCSRLTDITIPDSVTWIGNDAFYDCTGLTDVYYSGTEEQWADIYIDEGNECLENARIHFEASAPVCLTANIEQINDGYRVTVNVNGVTEGMTVYAAAYDASGRLIGVKNVDAAGGTAVFDELVSYKVFAWDKNLRPLPLPCGQIYSFPNLIVTKKAVVVFGLPSFLSKGCIFKRLFILRSCLWLSDKR